MTLKFYYKFGVNDPYEFHPIWTCHSLAFNNHLVVYNRKTLSQIFKNPIIFIKKNCILFPFHFGSNTILA